MNDNDIPVCPSKRRHHWWEMQDDKNSQYAVPKSQILDIVLLPRKQKVERDGISKKWWDFNPNIGWSETDYN